MIELILAVLSVIIVIIFIIVIIILEIMEKIDRHRFKEFKNIEEVKGILENRVLYETKLITIIKSCDNLKMQIDALKDDLNYLPRNKKESVIETLDLLCAEYQSLLKDKENLNLNISELDASLLKIYDDWRTKHGYKRQHYI